MSIFKGRHLNTVTKHFVPDTPPAGGYPRGKYPPVERTADERRDEQDAERKAVRSLSRAQLAAVVAEQDAERAACVAVRMAAERLKQLDELMVTPAEKELARLPRNERVELTTAEMRAKTATPRRPPAIERSGFYNPPTPPVMPKGVAHFSKIKLGSNIPSNSAVSEDWACQRTGQ